MPPEKRRSISYRSFVTCDNPKGVECGAIRKSKTTSQKKEQQNQTPSVQIINGAKKEMGIRDFTREFEQSPSFQLQQRPNSLNHVTSSCPNNGHKQEDIAQDFLKGVLDLQQSLAILRKLHETSISYKSSNRKQNKVGFTDMGKKLTDSIPFGYFHDEENFYMGSERSRLSVDGSSMKSFDEVKSVVRESLLRQNVKKKLDSPNLPSTSSSNSVFSDSCVQSQRKMKGKGSNLIVKLMGLESLPSSPRKCKGVEKVVSVSKPMYDIDSPKAWRPMLGTQELGSKQRAFDEILESLNFKGLLRSNSQKFEDFLPFDERPPIVVMRPIMRFWEDGDLENEEIVPRLSSSRRESFEERRFRKVGYGDETMRFGVHGNSQKKKATLGRVCGEDMVSLSGWKGEVKRKEQIIDGLRFQDVGKLSRVKIKRQKDGVLFSKNQTCCQKKANSNAIVDCRTVRTSDGANQHKKSRKPVSMMQVVRKENEASVREEIDSTRDDDECSFPTFDSMLMSKIKVDSWNKQSGVMNPDYDSENQISIADTRESITYISNDSKKSHQMIPIDMQEEDNLSWLSEITSTSISENCSSEPHLYENQSSVSEIPSVTTDDHQNYHSCEEHSIKEETEDNELSGNFPSSRAKLRAFFLSSPSFLTQAEELFNLQVSPFLDPHLNSGDVDNQRVLLDFANELMEIKRSQLSQLCLKPFLEKMCPQKSPSLNQLLEEVCQGIEDLTWKPNPGIGNLSSDQLYDLLNRDLMFQSLTWEIGWRNEFSWDEVEQVVGEIDKFVLGKLIEEVLVDFVQ